jgi:hypothetical protein
VFGKSATTLARPRVIGISALVLAIAAAAWAAWHWFGGESAPPPNESGKASAKDPDVREAQALWRKASRGDRKCLPELEKALGDPKASIREAAVVGMGFFAREADSAKLARVLKNDPAPAVRAAAAGQLGNQNKWENMPALVGALRDPNVSVRQRAYTAICDMLGVGFPFNPSGDEAGRDRDVSRVEKEYPGLEGSFREFRRRKEQKP